MTLDAPTTVRAGDPPGIRLADFLRARRAAVRPEEVGIRVVDRRRVPGLRREEVAKLAGIGANYYVHLEQGRDEHPSPHVLEALAGPLQLDEAGLRYAKRLAEPLLRRRRPGGPERLRPEMRQMVETLDRNPALVIGRYRDVLAANPLATALSPGFSVGSNILRYAFLDPGAREVYVNWEEVAVEAVRTLRFAIAENLDDATLSDLVAELTERSDQFREIWERQEVGEKRIGAKRFDHSVIGVIALEYQSLTINGSEGQSLSVYSAQPGSRDEQALDRLIAITAGGSGSLDDTGGSDPSV